MSTFHIWNHFRSYLRVGTLPSQQEPCDQMWPRHCEAVLGLASLFLTTMKQPKSRGNSSYQIRYFRSHDPDWTDQCEQQESHESESFQFQLWPHSYVAPIWIEPLLLQWVHFTPLSCFVKRVSCGFICRFHNSSWIFTLSTLLCFSNITQDGLQRRLTLLTLFTFSDCCQVFFWWMAASVGT